jgi:hypothetical protein
LPTTLDNQVGISDIIGSAKKGLISSDLVNEKVDETLPLEILFGFAERSSLFRSLWKLDNFTVIATGSSHGVQPISVGPAHRLRR